MKTRLWDFLNERIKKHENSWIIDSEKSETYGQLLNDVKKRSNWLDQNVVENKICVINCKNGLNAMTALLSCWRSNIIPIPVSMEYGSKRLKQVIQSSDPGLLMTDESGNLEITLRQKKESNPKLLNEISDGIICYTSGTTGIPKGVVLKGESLIFNVESVLSYFELKISDSILICRSLSHCAVITGEVLPALCVGSKIYFSSGNIDPFKISRIILEKKVSTICGTPTLIGQIAALIRGKRNNVRMISLSGEMLSILNRNRIAMSFPKADKYVAYGLTEAGTKITVLLPNLFSSTDSCVGNTVSKEVQFKIMQGGNVCTNYEQGEVFVKSPGLMIGYLGMEDKTNSVLKAGWLNTGDIGYKDKDCRLHILARSDEMILKAGMNIYPREIENQINSLSFIEASIAFPVVKKEGNSIGVDVVLNKGKLTRKVDSKQLIEIFSTVLPPYLVPIEVNIVDEIPYNSMGKIDRKEHSRRRK